MAKLKVTAPFNYREGGQTFHYPVGTYDVAERCSEKTISAAGAAHAEQIKSGERDQAKASAKPATKPTTSAE
ncbi:MULTISPECIES: hypothetical protein [unclassified Pseudomonas]|uniref:hypothetical protein n=1 Tax=unclassified Pseudomonas TaxID=196821 RepID=UPI00244B24BC|nr:MULTISPECIES: hypothetical protein [unclassified Pseudomonas]MDG9926118.1 hypothetical protein [Pseudomonas sp. GD04045]MDH0037462.1 hypothetical protein [Pseudomonas sp. GD04019]